MTGAAHRHGGTHKGRHSQCAAKLYDDKELRIIFTSLPELKRLANKATDLRRTH